MIFEIDGVPRDYAWGSTTAVQTMLGLPVDGRPIAELWFGAHPDSPSPVPSAGTTLDALIESDPETLLGTAVVEEFGPRLPFLLKILAAEKSLSMQVHPNLAQAREGFAREEAAGIPRDAPQRTYRDANHKPELLCALTPFEALCGFRSVAETLSLLDELDVPELAFLADLLRGPYPLRAAFTALLTHPDPAPLADVLARRAAGAQDGPLRAVSLAASDFPGDVGAVLSLLLNYVRLEPGEAIYLGAGNVHAYLRGTGVEILANSDNVLRCALTPKHVDVPELLKITDFSELPDPRWPDSGTGGFGVSFDVPVPDFQLHSADLDAYRRSRRPAGYCATGAAGLPYIVLCTSGSVTVFVGGAAVHLTPGRAAFVPAREEAFELRGRGHTFLATVLINDGSSSQPG